MEKAREFQVREIELTQKIPTHTAIMEIKDVIAYEIFMNEFDLKKEFLKPEPVWETTSIRLYEKDIEKTTQMGAQLTKPVQDKLSKFLKENRDVFAWLVWIYRAFPMGLSTTGSLSTQ